VRSGDTNASSNWSHTTRSAQTQATYQAGSHVSVAPPPAATYYGGGGGGCFDESCFVKVLNWPNLIYKNVADVRKGDCVVTHCFTGSRDSYNTISTISTVVTAIRIRLDNPKSNCMVKLRSPVFPGINDLIITKTHPVYYNGKWSRPIDLVNGVDCIECPSSSRYVYNFVLDTQGVAIDVNHYSTVTFGHGIPEAYHPFYSTQEIIDYISTLEDSTQGSYPITVHGKLLREQSAFSKSVARRR
jgi:hypothetical protein